MAKVARFRERRLCGERERHVRVKTLSACSRCHLGDVHVFISRSVERWHLGERVARFLNLLCSCWWG